MGICADPKYSGSGLNMLTLSVAVEELARGCASTGSIVSIHNCLYVNLLNKKGTEQQKCEFLTPFTRGTVGAFALSEASAGSDVSNIATTATKDGDFWILNGTKSWVSSGCEAESAIIFATVNKVQKHKGITAFIVPLNLPGVSRGRIEDKMGIRATSTCEIILENVKVPGLNVIGEVGSGFRLAMEQLDQARIGIASQAVGISQAAFETAIYYASQRIAFGDPILNLSSVQGRLAEMSLKIESARLLTRKAAKLKDLSIKSTKWSSLAKLAAGECATFVSNNCVQIMGGMGYVKNLPGERHYRDAKITEIYGGVTDVQKTIIAGELIKEYGLKV